MFRTRAVSSRSFKDRKRFDHKNFRRRRNQSKAALDAQCDRIEGTKARSLIETMDTATRILTNVTLI